jgi:hypothetical protein
MADKTEVRIVGSSDGEKLEALTDILTTGMSEFAGVVKELEKVAISSPIVSAVLAVILLDLMHRAGVKKDQNGMPFADTGLISDSAYNIGKNIIAFGMGATLAADVLSALPFAKGFSGNSVQTLVTSEAGSTPAQVGALMSKLAVKG